MVEHEESERHETVATLTGQPPSRKGASSFILVASAEYVSHMGQPLWRALMRRMNTFIKANCTTQVIPSTYAIVEEVVS